MSVAAFTIPPKQDGADAPEPGIADVGATDATAALAAPGSANAGVAADSAAVDPMAATSRGWLISRAADFWVACGGASVALLVMALVLWKHGPRELDFVDFLFAELHVGATYDAIWRRRLWKRMPWDVLAIPLVILVVTYTIMMSGRSIYIYTALMYLAVWHRGRQNYGVARYYQRQAGGDAGKVHRWLFNGAIYLPMLASVLFFTSNSPLSYEGSAYYPLPAFPYRNALNIVTGVLALLCVASYLVWSLGKRVHEAERWIVVAHTVAFGSAYFIGGWQVTFIIVLAIHHEFQYLYFAYAIARRDPARKPDTWRREFKFMAIFSLAPIIGLCAAQGVEKSQLGWLIPSGVGLLLCHYWIDGRIWKGAATRPA